VAVKWVPRQNERTALPKKAKLTARRTNMEMMVWNLVLTAIVAMLGFILKEKFAEINRLGILLNRTREEVARDHITRAEFRADMQQLLDRFDRIERKIDNLRGGNAQHE
jgi:Tfp pilus assembly protein PilN